MISPCEAHPLPTRACLFVSRRADGPAMGTPGRLPGYGHAGPTARLWARHMPYELVLLCSCLIVDITCDTSALLFAVACLLKLCAVAATPETALRPSRLVRRASHLPSPFSSSSRPGCWHPSCRRPFKLSSLLAFGYTRSPRRGSCFSLWASLPSSGFRGGALGRRPGSTRRGLTVLKWP